MIKSYVRELVKGIMEQLTPGTKVKIVANTMPTATKTDTLRVGEIGIVAYAIPGLGGRFLVAFPDETSGQYTYSELEPV